LTVRAAPAALLDNQHSRRLTFTIDKPLSSLRQTLANSVGNQNDSSPDQTVVEHLQRTASLLDLLRSLPDTEGIEFEPSPIQIQLRPFDLD